MKLGELISEVREKLKQDALKEANKVKDSDIVELKDGAEKVIKKINRGYNKRFCMRSMDIEGQGHQYDAYPTGIKRGRRRNVLTADEKLDIAYQVIVKQRK
jgi:hypothetical protein